MFQSTRIRAPARFRLCILAIAVLGCLPRHTYGQTHKAEDLRRLMSLVNKVVVVSRAQGSHHDERPYLTAHACIGEEKHPDTLASAAIMLTVLCHPGLAEDQYIDQYLEAAVWECLGRIADSRTVDAIDALDRFKRSVPLDGAWSLWYDDLLEKQRGRKARLHQ